MTTSRRAFLQSGAAAAWAFRDLPTEGARLQEQSIPARLRWFPEVPLARELWIVPSEGDPELGMLLESAAGLAAHAALHGKWRTLIYEDLDNDGYHRAIAAYRKAHQPQVRRLTIDEVVEHLHKANIARGYLLYHYDSSSREMYAAGALDTSVNTATSLSPSTRGLLISERLVERVERLGLKQIRDVRQTSESACLRQENIPWSRSVAATCDPKVRNARSLMIALDCFVSSGVGGTYRQALARCDPDSPILGWGCDAEDAQTIPSTRLGLFQTSTNWCHDLTIFSGEAPGKTIPAKLLRAPAPRHWSELDWGDGNHYAAFVMSDGDNVQWVMGNFTGGAEAPYYYGNPSRGEAPFGWGVPGPSLIQLAPRTLAEIFARATPNDGFIFFSGGGYFYPDLYGADPGRRQALEIHAERLNSFMSLADVRTLAFNFQKWNSPEARAACAVLASRIPGLSGILAFQYYPYSAGNGEIYWARRADGTEIPVASCRLCIWAHTGREHETTPAGVAAWLNKMPVLRDNASAANFSWVITHAWSRFRPASDAMIQGSHLAEEDGVSQNKDTPGSVRGYTSALMAIRRLNSHVKVVTPEEWLQRVCLRLRPQQTLKEWLRETESGARGRPRETEARRRLEQVHALLPNAGRNPNDARRCFETLREVAVRNRPGK